jgi:hypothetical protein
VVVIINIEFWFEIWEELGREKGKETLLLVKISKQLTGRNFRHKLFTFFFSNFLTDKSTNMYILSFFFFLLKLLVNFYYFVENYSVNNFVVEFFANK